MEGCRSRSRFSLNSYRPSYEAPTRFFGAGHVELVGRRPPVLFRRFRAVASLRVGLPRPHSTGALCQLHSAEVRQQDHTLLGVTFLDSAFCVLELSSRVPRA